MAILKVDTVSGIGTEGTVFEGDITFDSLNYMTLPKGTTTQSNRGRGVFGGGRTPTLVKTVQYIEIQSTGTSVDFGDKTDTRYGATAVSSTTRGVMAGGHSSSSSPYPVVNTMDYITIASTGHAKDFGNLANARRVGNAVCSAVRGVWAGEYAIDSPYPQSDYMQYINIASTGNAEDFGDMLNEGWDGSGVMSDSTRGLLVHGYTPGPTWGYNNTITYITIATKGNSVDFGDRNINTSGTAKACNSHGGLG